MPRDDAGAEPLDELLVSLARAAQLLDRDAYEQAGALAELAITSLTMSLGDGWRGADGATVLRRVGNPERGRALARALWIGSVVDEATGDIGRARERCLCAMEMYGRLRIESEELDMRAARELGSASRRLGATQNVRR